MFKEEITLENTLDREFADIGYIKEEEVRTLKVDAMPDTGAWTLVINEDIRQKLGLKTKRTSKSTLADGKTSVYDVTQVSIRWKDRELPLPAVVVPDAKEILLGALPLEALDLMVDPVRQKLVGAHGDEPVHVLY